MPCSILVPTRGRPDYLEVTLASVAPQAARAGAELLVIDDGDDPETREVARRLGATVVRASARGANAARNAGIAVATGDPIVLLDDDVYAGEGWLSALLEGMERAPDHDVFGGPIRAALDGGGPHSCGREGAAITTLELGAIDRDAEFVWSANMAMRRDALRRIGTFDETIHGRGEEEDWERRYLAAGGRIRYLADAGVAHRRAGGDASLAALARANYELGRTARRYDLRKRTAPSRAAEVRTLAECAAHVVRYRCPNMIAVGAQAAGRVREALTGMA